MNNIQIIFTPMIYKNRKVLTTEQLAEGFRTEPSVLIKNLNRDISQYCLGEHYYRLDGTELQDFEASNQIKLIPSRTQLCIWTSKGALLQARSLNTERAWQMYGELVDTYFNCPETVENVKEFPARIMTQLFETTVLTPIEIAIGIDEDGKVSARQLYEFLELAKSQFARWAKTNIESNQLYEENIDWWGFDMVSNGNETKEYKLTIDFAKHLAMSSQSLKGKEARNYFIKVEDKLRHVAIKASQLPPEFQMFKQLLDYQANINKRLESAILAAREEFAAVIGKTNNNLKFGLPKYISSESRNSVRYRDIDSLPDVITAPDLQVFFNWKKDKVYNLMNGKDFPSERFGRSRHMITKAKFLKWLGEEKQSAEKE